MKCECGKVEKLSGEEMFELSGRLLRKIKEQKTSWKELYQCTNCGQHWELSYPAAGDVCCVEPEFQRLSESDAKSEYLS